MASTVYPANQPQTSQEIAELPTKPQPGPPVSGPALSVVPFEPVVSTPPGTFLVSASPSSAKPKVSVASPGYFTSAE